MPETFTVELTSYEARALRVAAIFGGPPKETPDPGLESALDKLRAADPECPAGASTSTDSR